MRKLFLAAAILSTSCSANPRTYALDGTYGSLDHSGEMHRLLSGNDYTYTVKRLSLRFDPQSKTNAVDSIDNTGLRIVATRSPASPGEPHAVLYEKTVPIGIVLTPSNPSAEVAGISFTLPKEIVDRADYVGLALVDEKLMWPLSQDPDK